MPDIHNSAAAVQATIASDPSIHRTDRRFLRLAKLSDADVADIRQRFRDGGELADVARHYGITLVDAKRFRDSV